MRQSKNRITLISRVCIYLLLSSIFCINSTFGYSHLELEATNFIANKGYIVDNSSDVKIYRLDETISRKEFMKVVMKISGSSLKDSCIGSFVDVSSDWGCKYIEGGLTKGYIVKNVKFRPNDEISKLEAIKLIFKARSISKKYNKLSWQDNYIKSSFDAGLIKSTNFDYNVPAKRSWIFELAAKTFTEYESGDTSNKSTNNIKIGEVLTTLNDGMLEGEYTEYFLSGEKKSQSKYLNGKLYGESRGYYENGSVNYVAFYKNGRLEGEFIKYFESGIVSQKEFYDRGLLNGISYFYNSDGILFKEREYIGGFLLKEKIY